MAKIDGLEIVMTKQMQKMIDKELKKRFEELKPELATRYEELLNMRNMETDQFNDGFNDARAGKLETDHPHYDLDTDNWRLGYAWGMFEPMKEKLARERQVSDAHDSRHRKEFCPNCEAETPCTHEAELFVCDICGEDFAKYIVSRNCNVSDVSMTRDVLTDIKTPLSIENTNPYYYKHELDRLNAEIKTTDDLLKEATETIGAGGAMITKITDERLKDIIESTPEFETYLLSALNELVSLRSQVKAFADDAISLATSLRNIRLMFVHIEVESDKKYVKQMEDALEKHTALLKELDK